MIKKITYTFLFLISISLYSQQEKLNSYKYIIVPNQFSFLKKPDQYKTSSLTKFLLKKNGFNVFLSDEKLPQDLMQNRCLALTANVLDHSGMFSTKMTIEFKDCYNKVVYTTGVGKSKEKDYKKAYQEGIRNAYNSLSEFTYSYSQKQLVSNTKNLDAVVTDIPKTVITPVVKKSNPTKITTKTAVLYAQPKSNGFQLVNTKPEVVFVIFNTNLKEVFIIKDTNGIFYKVGGKWVAEYYVNNKLITKTYDVKF